MALLCYNTGIEMPDDVTSIPGAFTLYRRMTMNIISHSKRCTKCSVEKPLTEFHRRNSSPCGYKSACKACRMAEIQATDATWLSPDTIKVCRKCNAEKPASAFDVNVKVSSGYFSTCQECRRARANAWKAENKDRIRAYEEANRDYLRELRKDWARRNPDRYQTIRKRHYEGHKEYYARKARAWYAANRDRSLARSHAYFRTESGKIRRRLAASKYRALRKEGDATLEEINALMQRQTKCAYCKKKFTGKMPATIDHVIPLSKGGLHTISNLVLACRSCNSRKHNNDWFLI